MIPKKIFFIWEGAKLSWMRYMSIYSFKKLNPEWEVCLYYSKIDWTQNCPWEESAKQDFFNYEGNDYFDKLEPLGIILKNISDIKEYIPPSANPVQKSDFIRWIILSKEGGFYSDTDVLYVSPINELYDQIKLYNIVTCFYDIYFSIGFLGSSPDNNFFRDVYETSLIGFNPVKYESAGIPVIHKVLTGGIGPHYKIIDKLKRKYSYYRVYHCGKEVIYPFSKEEIFNQPISMLYKNTVGIHWFAGYPMVQEYNNKLDEHNYINTNNTFTFFVNVVMDKTNRHGLTSIIDTPIDEFDIDKKFFNGTVTSVATTENDEINFNGQYSATELGAANIIRNFITSRKLLTDEHRKFCDVGAGVGVITELLQEAGYYNSYAIDGSDYGIKNGLIKCPIEYYGVYDFTKPIDIPQFEAYFDVVTCFQTLECIPMHSIRQFIANLFYIGNLVICSVNKESYDYGIVQNYNVKPMSYWIQFFREFSDNVEFIYIPGLNERWTKSKFLMASTRR